MDNNNKEEFLEIEIEDICSLESPKSPKTPKLSEELSEIRLESEYSCEHVDEVEEVVNVENLDGGDNNPIYDKIKSILKEIIQNCPAGQVEIVGSLCVELFGNPLEGFIEKEVKDKMIQDGDFDDFEEDDCSEFAKEMKLKLESYVKELYPGSGIFSIKQTNPNEWKIQILGKRLKPKAFWSGHWHSTWIVKFKEDESGSEDGDEKVFSLNGRIGLTVHYHEEGTVQLSAHKEIPSRVNFYCETSSKATDKIYWKIRDSEDVVQVAVNEAYRRLGEDIFKKLRRQLPVTRTKMDWNNYRFKGTAEIRK